jgi:rRNA maturation protein Nop10
MSNFLYRLDKIEKTVQKTTDGARTVVIKINRYSPDDNFEKNYALFQARLTLGSVSFDEKKRRIMVPGPKLRERYADLTIDQANKIFKEYGDAA